MKHKSEYYKISAVEYYLVEDKSATSTIPPSSPTG